MTLAYLTAALPSTAGGPCSAVVIAGLFAPLIRDMCSHSTMAQATSGGRRACETAREVEISFASYPRGRVRKAL